jgi:hypothetical protein
VKKLTISWDLRVGDKLIRRDLHARFGGSWYGGIEPSGKTPNVLLFTDREAGKRFGYNFDGWHPDGTFHYTGEGQLGDQSMREGNRAIRDHGEEGRALRLFVKDGTSVTYAGEFELPNESHILFDEAPDREGFKRQVFVFRLRAVGEIWSKLNVEAPSEMLPFTLPIEANNVEAYVQQREAGEPREALRKEALLVQRFVEWLESHRGETAERQGIPTAAGRTMFTDAYVRESRELVEAKASSSREHIRMALGQILDHGRYVDHSRLAVLVPTRPPQEMVGLLVAQGVGCIWETEPGHFEAERPADVWQ